MGKFYSLYLVTVVFLPQLLDICMSQENYQDLLSSDPRVRGALGKVTAHLESNSRQAQNLRSKFSQFSFLWEHDVQQTFRAFLAGEAPPHPKRLSRPETVRSRGSARPHSSGSSTRPKRCARVCVCVCVCVCATQDSKEGAFQPTEKLLLRDFH